MSAPREVPWWGDKGLRRAAHSEATRLLTSRTSRRRGISIRSSPVIRVSRHRSTPLPRAATQHCAGQNAWQRLGAYVIDNERPLPFTGSAEGLSLDGAIMASTYPVCNSDVPPFGPKNLHLSAGANSPFFGNIGPKSPLFRKKHQIWGSRLFFGTKTSHGIESSPFLGFGSKKPTFSGFWVFLGFRTWFFEKTSPHGWGSTKAQICQLGLRGMIGVSKTGWLRRGAHCGPRQ